jgi:hypothetical protein
MKPRQPWFTRSQIMLSVFVIVIFVGNTFATGPVEKVVYRFAGSLMLPTQRAV